MAAPAIAIWVATHVFFRVAGVEPLHQAPQPILSLVVPLLLLALIYFLLNSWLIAGAVGFEKGISPFVVWRDNFLWLSLNYFSGASVAALLLPYLQAEDHALFRIASILLPLLLISYLTFKTALGRVDDANRHLSELNRLYLSTIETLAMAIDAKDQITHGHIRRVQHFAVGLARRIGITEEDQIKAIEAASLLHDMGKLAIPEYILNKPGRLTPAEFDKMKLHASVGADILSAIDFPYPVVPIVRHHHENWDGSGYPDGIKGGDIPIGARILSVVDCFDALTSDRPYRPRLSDGEAIQILLERRGSMYDPLVVDIFVAVHHELAPKPEEPTLPEHGLSAITRDNVQAGRVDQPIGAGLDDISASTEEMSALFELARGLAADAPLSRTIEEVATHLRRVIPSSTCAFFTYESATDELSVSHAVGEHSNHFKGLRIPRGQRLTGWVAANRRTIMNSDPVLDLGEIARGLRPRLRACLSTPVIANEQLCGVLSLYSVERDAFDEDHRRIVETIGRQIAFALKPRSDTIHEREFRRQSAVDDRTIADTSDGALSIALIQFGIGRPSRDTDAEPHFVLLANTLRNSLRSSDVLFRYSQSELVILLAQTPAPRASHIARRVVDDIREIVQHLRTMNVSPSSITVATATAPMDGADLDTLVAVARRRAEPIDDLLAGPTSIH
jgi:putative nucleotidyltransferase with HDIG domain